ncbi:MAG: terminase family protein [Armatimonadota bacterium]
MRAEIDAKQRIALARRLFGWQPHPTQRIWLMDESRVKVAACGRRWGKTEAAAVDAATFAVAAPGSVQMIVSPTYDQSRLIYDTVERMIFDQSLIRRESKATKTPYPKLRIGKSLIMARTADEDGRNLRGHSADRVIVDEAAYVKDAVVEEVIGPMLADRDGQLVMISTPFGKNHFYRAFVNGVAAGKGSNNLHLDNMQMVASECSGSAPDGTGSEAKGREEQGMDGVSSPCSGRYSSYRFPSWENPHISREYIEFQRSVVTPRQFAVEYEAEFLDDQTSVFPWETIQSAVNLGKAEIDSEEPWIVAGVDWARYSDYTAVVAVDVGSSPSKIISIDRFNRLSWESQIERAAAFLERNRVNAVLTDQTSVGDPLLEQLRKRLWENGAGMAVDGFTFTNSGKREIIDNLVIRLTNHELAIPDDEQLIRELQYFEYELTTAGNVRMNARSGYTDDIVAALALAAWRGRSHSGPARFLASGERRNDAY